MKGLLDDAITLQYADVRSRILGCKRCPHSHEVLRPLPGYGAIEDVRIMVVGQSPALGEDRTGQLMSKPAGEHIRNQFYERLRLTDKQIYWCNIVCCPPPRNDEGEIDADMIKACAPHFEDLIDVLNPRLIVGMGNLVRTRMFMQKYMKSSRKKGSSLIAARFAEWDYRGYPFVIITNPAAVLRFRGFEKKLYEEDIDRDFEFLKSLIDRQDKEVREVVQSTVLKTKKRKRFGRKNFNKGE